MQMSPFPLLRPFDTSFDVRLLTREDNIGSDADLAQYIQSKNIVSLHQKHSNRAVRVSQASSRTIEADALFTDTPSLTLSIRFADCQNAVIIVPNKKIVGLVHAGWRGIQSRVMSAAYVLLKEEWDIDPMETFVGLGPALCTACADFTNPQKEVPELATFITAKCIDLRAALDAELKEIGVPKTNIERLPDCTRCKPDLYWTYRGGDREAVKQGRTNVMTVSGRRMAEKAEK